MKSREINILILDDEIELMRVLCMNLDIMGFNCMLANNTKEAKAYLENYEIDLVISDLIMPGANGINFFQSLKETSNTLPPFIFYSGLSDLPLIKPYPEGIIGFIQKPFSLEDILNIIPEDIKPLEV